MSWRVKAAYLYLLDEAKVGRDPWQQLAILKRAIVDATWNMQEELTRSNSFSEATENDDKVGWTMRMVRAIERNNWSSTGKCVQAYPHLENFSPDSRTGRIDGARMRSLREHAVFLHRADLLDETRSIQADSGEDDAPTQANRRSRIAAKL